MYKQTYIMAAEAIKRDFVSDLLSYFQSKPEIEAAYFGYLYSADEKVNHLFLGIQHKGQLKEIKEMTYSLKSFHFPNEQILFTATEDHPELLDLIKSTYFPFYEKNVKNDIHLEIIRQFFDQKYKSSLIDAIKKNKVCFLGNVDEEDGIYFQTYIKEGHEFIPIFSSKEMVFRCGVKSIPSHLNLIQIKWEEVMKWTDAYQEEPTHYFILNPSHPFEVELFGIELLY